MVRPLESLFRLWFLLILAYFAWTAYLIGWTDYYSAGGDEFAVGSWAARVRYAGTGINAALHLNIAGIAQGVGVVIFLAFGAIMFWPKRYIVEDAFDLFALTALLAGLSVYTFALIDKPTNYYHSRYYLPVIIPLMFVYTCKQLRSVPGWVFAGLIVTTMLLGAPYSLQVSARPPFQERVELIRHAQATIPPHSTILAWGSEGRPFNLMLTNIAKYHLKSTFFHVGTKESTALVWIEAFLCVVNSDPLYVVTDHKADEYLGTKPVAEFRHNDRHYPARKPYYPLKSAPLRTIFYYYRLDGPEYRLPIGAADASRDEGKGVGSVPEC